MNNSNLILRPTPIRKKRLYLSAITGIIIAASIVLYSFDPVSSNVYPPSPFRALTGLFCPGCGTLRGLHQLLHGNWLKALDYNPLMVLSLPFLAYSYITYAIEAITKQQLPKFYLKPALIWALFYGIIAYWILRNIPVAPFSWLAP